MIPSQLYLSLISIGISFLQQFLGSLIKAKAPQEVLDGVQASITALEAHQTDLMTKAEWEALRG